MLWRIILEEFGPNIQHIYVFDNIVAYTLSILPSSPSDKYQPCIRKGQYCVNQIFTLGRIENKKYCFPLNLLILQREQQKKLRNINSKLSTYISDQGYSYSMQALDYIKIICYDRKIYVPQSLRRSVLYWYHFYLNHPGGSILVTPIREVCYWNVLVAQAELFAKMCKTFQQFKKRKTIYGHLTPYNI